MKIVQIEKERGRVAEVLHGSASERRKLKAIVRFLLRVKGEADFDLIQSYYMEFSSFLFSLIKTSTLAYSGPEYILRVYALLEEYRSQLKKEVDPGTVDRSMQTVERILAQTWFTVGEWERGIEALEKASRERVDVKEKQTLKAGLEGQSDPYEQLLTVASVLQGKYVQSYQICREILDRWTQDFGSPQPDQANLIFVEREQPEKVAEEHDGVVLPISLKVRIRPRDAEEDIVKVNNALLPGSGEFSLRFRDAIATVRSVAEAKLPKYVVDRYYTFQFSLPEKSASFLGDSWFGMIALLAYCGMANVLYPKPLALLNSGTAVTGAMDLHGRLLPVDEDGLRAKVVATFFSPVKRLVVPWKNLPAATRVLESLHQRYPNRHLILESAANLGQLVEDRNLVIQKKLTLTRRVISGIQRNGVRLGWAAVFLIPVLVFLGILLKGDILKDRNPAAFDLVGQYLVVKNVAGEELWQYDFGEPLTKRYYTGISRNIILKDIDKDGNKELIFGVYEDNFPLQSGHLFLFDDDGTILFKKKTGRELAFGDKNYSDHYRIVFVDAVDLDDDGRNEIVSISHQFPYFPCCVNVWNLQGEKLGEYWHSGQLERLDYIDLDSDGVKEIFALGQNNEYRCAAMAVLKPFDMDGASPQILGSDYFTDSIPLGKELYFIRFPQSDIHFLLGSNDKTYQIIDQGQMLQLAVGNMLVASTNRLDASNILYYFLGRNLSFKGITISDNYKQKVYQLTGKEIDVTSLERRLKNLLYYDGEKWVNKPTMTKYWKEKPKE